MSILLMPDHGETVYLDDDTSDEAAYREVRRLFAETHCEQVTVATRTHPGCEICDAQLVVQRDTLGRSDVINLLIERVTAHEAYRNPLADPVPDIEKAVAAVVAQDVHPTLHVPYDTIAAPFSYHLGSALVSLLNRDYRHAEYHLNRQREIDAVAD